MASTDTSKPIRLERVHVRYGRDADATALNELHNYYIVKTPVTFDLEPWSLEQRHAWLDEFDEEGPYRLLVAEHDGLLLGFTSSHRYREKAAYSTTIETSIYCREGFVGHGIGSLLYTRLFEALKGQPIHMAIAGITLPNDASVAIHRRFGFELSGVNHAVGRKFDQFWDVAWYEKVLD